MEPIKKEKEGREKSAVTFEMKKEDELGAKLGKRWKISRIIVLAR